MPRPPPARSYVVGALDDAACRSEQQPDCRVGDRRSQDAGGVPNRNPATGAAAEVDVVDTDGHGTDDPQPGGSCQQFGVDVLGQHAEQPLDVPDRGEQPLARHDLVSVPHLDEAGTLEQLNRPTRRAPCHQDARTSWGGVHGARLGPDAAAGSREVPPSPTRTMWASVAAQRRPPP